MNAVQIRDLTVAYHEEAVLWDVDLDIPMGPRTAIIGPNGAGKSTLLKAILELTPRSSGTVKFFDEQLDKVRSRVAYVPQRSAADWDFPTDALDVVLMGLYPKLGWFRRPTRKHRDEALACLATVGMVDLAHRQISQLSGGQQQRVFLARALAQEADLLLMDEPFAGVDAVTEEALIQVMSSLHQEGKTIVAVHHDLGSAPEIFDQAILINRKVIAQGPANEVLTPEAVRRCYGRRAGA